MTKRIRLKLFFEVLNWTLLLALTHLLHVKLILLNYVLFFLGICIFLFFFPKPKPGVYKNYSLIFYLWMFHLQIFKFMSLFGFFKFIHFSLFARHLYFISYGSSVSFFADLSENVSLKDPYLLTIGDQSFIGSNCVISCHLISKTHLVLAPISIENNVFIGPDTRIEPGNLISSNTQIPRGQVIKMFSSLY